MPLVPGTPPCLVLRRVRCPLPALPGAAPWPWRTCFLAFRWCPAAPTQISSLLQACLVWRMTARDCGLVCPCRVVVPAPLGPGCELREEMAARDCGTRGWLGLAGVGRDLLLSERWKVPCGWRRASWGTPRNVRWNQGGPGVPRENEDQRARSRFPGSLRHSLYALSGPLSKSDGGPGPGCQGQAPQPPCRSWRDVCTRPHGLPGPAPTHNAQVYLLARRLFTKIETCSSAPPGHLGPGLLKQGRGTRPQKGWGGRNEDPGRTREPS